eukprot:1914532-Rhodomonas_salina.3
MGSLADEADEERDHEDTERNVKQKDEKMEVKTVTRFVKIVKAFGAHIREDGSKYKFIDAEGRRIAKNKWGSTMEVCTDVCCELDIRDNDELSAMLEQVGGRQRPWTGDQL